MDAWNRPRAADDVRRSALLMAERKLAAGCTGCAAHFLELARRNGATAEELAAASSSVPPTTTDR